VKEPAKSRKHRELTFAQARADTCEQLMKEPAVGKKSREQREMRNVMRADTLNSLREEPASKRKSREQREMRNS
jgi:hypothetical protein